MLDSGENSGGQSFLDTHEQSVAAPFDDDVGQTNYDGQPVLARIITQIRETHRQRQDLHRAEKSLTLQIKAVERRLSGAISTVSPKIKVPRDLTSGSGQGPRDSHSGIAGSADLSGSEGQLVDDAHDYFANTADLTGDQGQEVGDAHIASADIAYFATLPLQEAREVIHKSRIKLDRQLAKLAKQLPVWPWVEAIHGFGALGLAQIVGEAGDLSNYANPGKLWKRMGLAVINGKSQRRVAGAEALEHGYSPVRRSIMYCIGDSMIKKQNAYRDLYLSRKEYEAEKVPDGTKILWHRRAQRYMEKRLIRDLWRAWRDSRPGVPC